MKLLRDNLIVKQLPNPEKIGSIYIPEKATSGNSLRCQVIQVGQGLKPKKVQEYIPLDVEVGDTVFIPKFATNQISIDGVDYFLIKIADVLGIESES